MPRLCEPCAYSSARSSSSFPSVPPRQGGMLALEGKHVYRTTLALAGKPPVAPNECVSASCRLRRPRLTSNRGYPILSGLTSRVSGLADHARGCFHRRHGEIRAASVSERNLASPVCEHRVKHASFDAAIPARSASECINTIFALADSVSPAAVVTSPRARDSSRFSTVFAMNSDRAATPALTDRVLANRLQTCRPTHRTQGSPHDLCRAHCCYRRPHCRRS